MKERGKQANVPNFYMRQLVKKEKLIGLFPSYTGLHLNWGILLRFYIFIKYLYCENEDIFQQLTFDVCYSSMQMFRNAMIVLQIKLKCLAEKC